MQHAQGLEGTQELPLDESPTDGKDFLDAAGYVKTTARFLKTKQNKKVAFFFLLVLLVTYPFP